MDIFPDTNIVLHYRRADELDWCTLAGTKSCNLVITPVLMHELERNKIHNPNAGLRQRAKDFVRWLGGKMSEEDPVRLRDGVTLLFDDQEPLIDFAEQRLSRDVADDHLIASALAWAQRVGREVGIVSADGGMALKLRSRSVRLLVPDEAWRLPDVVDEERAELRRLQRDLAMERNRRPVLQFQFEDAGRSITIGPEPVDRPEPVEARRLALPPMTLADYRALDERTEPGVRVYESKPVDRYNQELEEYFTDYEAFLAGFEIWAEQEARTLELGFVLANTGAAPATSIDVLLTFPKHVMVLPAAEGPDPPDEPVVPIRPQPHKGSVKMARAIPLGAPAAKIPLEGEPQVSADKRHVEYSVRALKHECALVLEPVLVVFASRDAMQPFEIEIAATCNETGKIGVRLAVIPDADSS